MTLSLIDQDRQLPVKPTAADTADWYRLGDAVEGHGRHMKRQAVAAEYNSGRNMAEFCRLIDQPERTIREYLTEARELELLQPCDTSQGASEELSQALPTARAAREYAKAEPEVREVIKEIIKEDPEAEIKAAEIKRLRSELSDANKQLEKKAPEIRSHLIDTACQHLEMSLTGLASDVAEIQAGRADLPRESYERLQLKAVQAIKTLQEFTALQSVNLTTSIIDV